MELSDHGPEVALLKSKMTIERTYEQARMQFVEGLFKEKFLLLMYSQGKQG